jgi:hypothetical protein
MPKNKEVGKNDFWLDQFKKISKDNPELLNNLQEDKKKELGLFDPDSGSDTDTDQELEDYYNLHPEEKPQNNDIYGSKTEREYWELLKNRKPTEDKHLLKNQFQIVHESNRIDKLLKFLSEEKCIFIGGGYPTLMHLGKNLKDFPESDIDLYIFHNKKETSAEFNNLVTNDNSPFKRTLNFINENYQIENILAYRNKKEGKHNSVINVITKKLERTIQIIGANCQSISEILNTYDFAHSKCGIYMGETYVTYDAKYAKKTGATVCYGNHKIRRLQKAKKLGFDIYGYISDSFKNMYDESPVPQFEMTKDDITENFVLNKHLDLEYDYYGNNHENIMHENFKDKMIRESRIFNPLFPTPDFHLPNDKIQKFKNLFSYSYLSLNDIKKIFVSQKNIGGFNPNYSINFNKYHQRILTEPIKMEKSTIFPISKFHPEDKYCVKFFIPMGEEFGSENSRKFFSQIDQNFDKYLKQIKDAACKKNETIDYIPIIRRTRSENEEKNYNRIKVAIPHSYDDQKNVSIKIKVVKRDYVKEITTIDELRKEFVLGCKASFELSINGLMVSKNLMMHNKRMCLFQIVCKSIIIHDDKGGIFNDDEGMDEIKI